MIFLGYFYYFGGFEMVLYVGYFYYVFFLQLVVFCYYVVVGGFCLWGYLCLYGEKWNGEKWFGVYSVCD